MLITPYNWITIPNLETHAEIIVFNSFNLKETLENSPLSSEEIYWISLTLSNSLTKLSTVSKSFMLTGRKPFRASIRCSQGNMERSEARLAAVHASRPGLLTRVASTSNEGALHWCVPAHVWTRTGSAARENQTEWEKGIPQFLERMLLKIASGKQIISYN